MSYEIAGRMGWLVTWWDQWRARTNVMESRTWNDWVEDFSHGLSKDSLDDDAGWVIESIAAKHIKEAVEQLSEHERRVLLLHVNCGLTYTEIAHRLLLDKEDVLRDLSHAYSQLRLELSMDELRR